MCESWLPTDEPVTRQQNVVVVWPLVVAMVEPM
jgi:hypothetical protein